MEGAPPENRSRQVRRWENSASANPSYQNPPARPRFPFVQEFLPLRRCHRQLHETVERSTQTKKSFDHAGEQKRASPDELVFVELHLYTNASRKCGSVVRAHRSELTTAADLDHTVDHILRVGRAADVIQAKYLLKRVFPFLHE